jgi:predicted Rossmann fold nucleotide-binding protein DprA/Smf involved in DNA uptake
VESGADILSEFQPSATIARNAAKDSSPEVLQHELPLTGQDNHLALNATTISSAAPGLGRLQPLIPNSPIWGAIGYDPITEEQLQRRTGLAPAQLQVELFTLELEGHIERRGHGQFVRAHARTAC